MYSYSHDAETGGLLLNSAPCLMSKEPRPVYASELDLLGFGKHWQYERQSNVPYLWAEANKYWYRGRLVATTKGGDLYHAPELLVHEDGLALSPVDLAAMTAKNRELLAVVEQATLKRIYEVWRRWYKRLDVFHVAFSGGKDSIVLLELVKKALPKDAFCVVFGDTGMEFPDTYAAVEAVKAQCAAEGIAFYTAQSRLQPEESWNLFGPPSRVLRWCCSVHKSAPQTLKLREVLGKNDYRGLAFVGVRAQESENRSKYDFFESGKKVKGQHSHNSILDWSSAEIWLYSYANKLVINEAYKKGSARVGCLCCPLGGGKAFIEKSNYPQEVETFAKIILESNARQEADPKTYLTNGGWNARKNGRFLVGNDKRYLEKTNDGVVEITVMHPLTDWREWIKTLGDLRQTKQGFELATTDSRISFSLLHGKKDGYTVSFSESLVKSNPVLSKLLRQVFRKAAYCVKCGTCQSDCQHGCITFNPLFSIKGCVRCQACHTVNAGCLVYDSLKIPTGDGESKNMGINTFSNHAPKSIWLGDFFERGADFLSTNNLGPVQNTKFKRFLTDAGLITKKGTTPLFAAIRAYGWNNEISLGIMLGNLAYNPQFSWYISQFNIGRIYVRHEVEAVLKVAFEQSEGNISSIVNAWRRICETPFGKVLKFGQVLDAGEFLRTPCVITEPLVVLYSLFKFSEACGDYRQFTLGRLMDFSVDSDGVSPAQIFGIERERLHTMLEGLAANHSDFLTVSFTHDLEKISLAEGKTSGDVLGRIFGEGII